MLELRLYIIGKTPKAIKATEHLRALLDDQYKDEYTLEVVDVLENPGLAEHDKILATPTVVKRLPDPIRKVIGDLADKEKVLLGLNLIDHEQEINKQRLEGRRTIDEGRMERRRAIDDR